MNSEILEKLYNIIEARQASRTDGSYVASLFEKGIPKIAQKVGEEAVETVIEALKIHGGDVAAKELFKEEAADLLFHFLILCKAVDIHPDEVLKTLEARMK